MFVNSEYMCCFAFVKNIFCVSFKPFVTRLNYNLYNLGRGIPEMPTKGSGYNWRVLVNCQP